MIYLPYLADNSKLIVKCYIVWRTDMYIGRAKSITPWKQIYQTSPDRTSSSEWRSFHQAWYRKLCLCFYFQVRRLHPYIPRILNMLQRGMRLLTRKLNRDQCSCLCFAVSTQQDFQTIRTSAAVLQQDFSVITDSERQHILNVYNQILPFIYKQEREMKHASETGALDTIFDDTWKTYWHR